MNIPLMCQVTHFLPSSWTAADSHEPGHQSAASCQIWKRVTFIVSQTALRQTWHQGRQSHFCGLCVSCSQMEPGAATQWSNRKRSGEWQLRSDAQCTTVIFWGGISRGDCVRLWAVSPEASFILMFPSELSHAKLHWLLTLIHLGCKGLTALTCSSLFDSFVLRKCYSFSFLLLSIQWFLSFVCVVTLQTRSGAYETSRWHPFYCFKHYLYVLRAFFVSRQYLQCKTTMEVSYLFFSSLLPAPSLSTVLSTNPNPIPGQYVPVHCDKQQLLACMLKLYEKRQISLFSSSCGAPVFPMHSYAAGCHR